MCHLYDYNSIPTSKENMYKDSSGQLWASVLMHFDFTTYVKFKNDQIRLVTHQLDN